MFIVFGRDISLIMQTREISLRKNNSHDLHRVITHSLVLVILVIRSIIIFSWKPKCPDKIGKAEIAGAELARMPR